MKIYDTTNPSTRVPWVVTTWDPITRTWPDPPTLSAGEVHIADSANDATADDPAPLGKLGIGGRWWFAAGGGPTP